MFEGNKESINKFDYFMELARDQAKLSSKKNTKVGALLIDNNGLVLLSECNDYIEPVYSNPSILNKVALVHAPYGEPSIKITVSPLSKPKQYVFELDELHFCPFEKISSL